MQTTHFTQQGRLQTLDQLPAELAKLLFKCIHALVVQKGKHPSLRYGKTATYAVIARLPWYARSSDIEAERCSWVLKHAKQVAWGPGLAGAWQVHSRAAAAAAACAS